MCSSFGTVTTQGVGSSCGVVAMARELRCCATVTIGPVSTISKAKIASDVRALCSSIFEVSRHIVAIGRFTVIMNQCRLHCTFRSIQVL
jgi:hypothetical protein